MDSQRELENAIQDMVGESGKWTFFLIDLDAGRVVEVLETVPGQKWGPDLVHRAAALAQKTGHRYSIAQSKMFIEPPKTHQTKHR